MSKEPLPPSKRKPSRSYLEYATLVYQLFAAIFIGVAGGIWLDAHLHSRPWFTVILSLLGVAAGMYLAVRSVMHDNKKND